MTECVESINSVEASAWKAEALIAIESICNQLKGSRVEPGTTITSFDRLTYAGISKTSGQAAREADEADVDIKSWGVTIEFYEIQAVADLVTLCVPGKKEIDFSSIESIIFAKREVIKAKLNESAVKE